MEHLVEEGLTVFLLFLCCCSPQLRMSFIVFSTEGRILMSLTEDRWVFIPFTSSAFPSSGWMWYQVCTQLTHLQARWHFRTKMTKTQVCGVCGGRCCSFVGGECVESFLSRLSQHSQRLSTAFLKSLCFPCVTVWLASTHKQFEFTHLLLVAGVFWKEWPYGNYYSAATPFWLRWFAVKRLRS